MIRPSFQSALGISSGDIVRTSYGTGPYEVWSIWGPRMFVNSATHIVIWDVPVISLTLTHVHGGVPRDNSDFFYLNEISRHGNRWLMANCDELFVESAGTRVIQSSLFGSSEDEPVQWPFHSGVDYSSKNLFHCETCGIDFNKVPEWQYDHRCLTCGRQGVRIIMMHRLRQLDGFKVRSSYQRYLGVPDPDPIEVAS